MPIRETRAEEPDDTGISCIQAHDNYSLRFNMLVRRQALINPRMLVATTVQPPADLGIIAKS